MNRNFESQGLPSVGILQNPSEEELEQIVALERSIFEWEVSDEDMEDLAETIKNPDSVVSVIRNTAHEVVGYLLAIPATSADETIQENDPDFAPQPQDLYIETFAIAPKHRLIHTGSVIKALAQEAVRRGYSRLVAHVPVDHADKYESFGARAVRTIEPWYDSGEAHVYIEYELG